MPPADGGHGLPCVEPVPAELLPLLLPWFPAVDGFEFDPVFGVEPAAPLAVPGKLPHGEPLGELPGFVEVLGFTVDGCVEAPGVGVLGELEPGIVFGVPLGEVEPGVAEPGVVCEPGVV